MMQFDLKMCEGHCKCDAVGGLGCSLSLVERDVVGDRLDVWCSWSRGGVAGCLSAIWLGVVFFKHDVLER